MPKGLHKGEAAPTSGLPDPATTFEEPFLRSLLKANAKIAEWYDIPTPAVPAEQQVAEADFTIGALVRMFGLEDDDRDANGRLGLVTESGRDDGMIKVRMKNLTQRLFSPAKMEVAEVDEDELRSFMSVVGSMPELKFLQSDGRPAPAAPPPKRPRLKVFLVGTWNAWVPWQMTWQVMENCYRGFVPIGPTAEERFQIVLDGDWKRTLHPATAEGCHFSSEQMQGPDNRGQGLTWAITNGSDNATPGAWFEVRLHCSSDGFPVSVDWHQSNPSSTQSAGIPLPRRPEALSMMLKSARPDWKDSDLQAVIKRLQRVCVKTSLDLLALLNTKDGQALNELLKMYGEKAFLATTLGALRTHQALSTASKGQPAQAPDSSAPSPPPAQQLPTADFQVLKSELPVHEQPRSGLPLHYKRSMSEDVKVVFETCDGWVLLDGERGWVPSQMELGKTLASRQKPSSVAWPSCGDDMRGLKPVYSREFVVVHKPHVVARCAPFRSASMLAIKPTGDKVMVDAQTY
eukprot:CAMPEP_0178440000 /NCGR_PEP_ID=MMETSP0689_2-20121128/36501_1 /TAXON_ID=160604 /ORGANISM="Amphidinium massartii, Strain CS-259" /LENGTH=515 /DNA_ID=CAMNT_0020062657 /DNA_START=25 /DNA_END=1569 /DNA_ORIENTATION=-